MGNGLIGSNVTRQRKVLLVVRVMVGLLIVVLVTRLHLNDVVDYVVSTALLALAGWLMFPFMFRPRSRPPKP